MRGKSDHCGIVSCVAGICRAINRMLLISRLIQPDDDEVSCCWQPPPERPMLENSLDSKACLVFVTNWSIAALW